MPSLVNLPIFHKFQETASNGPYVVNSTSSFSSSTMLISKTAEIQDLKCLSWKDRPSVLLHSRLFLHRALYYYHSEQQSRKEIRKHEWQIARTPSGLPDRTPFRVRIVSCSLFQYFGLILRQRVVRDGRRSQSRQDVKSSRSLRTEYLHS